MGEYDRPAKIVVPDRLGCGRACEASFAGGRAIPARIGVSDLGGERKGSRGNRRSSEAQFRACECASGYGPAQVALREPAPYDCRRGSDRGHSRRIHVSNAVLVSGESTLRGGAYGGRGTEGPFSFPDYAATSASLSKR